MSTSQTLRIEFELNERDFQHFRDRLDRARSARAGHAEADIIDGASKLLADALASAPADFIAQRIRQLEPLIGMLRDNEWRLEGDDRARVLDALAYFVEPDDLIPDNTPGIGYLDDAIMIELVASELTEEIRAYEDFCAFRGESSAPDATRLMEERESLQRRMRRRSRAGRRAGGTSQHSPFSLF